MRMWKPALAAAGLVALFSVLPAQEREQLAWAPMIAAIALINVTIPVTIFTIIPSIDIRWVFLLPLALAFAPRAVSLVCLT